MGKIPKCTAKKLFVAVTAALALVFQSALLMGRDPHPNVWIPDWYPQCFSIDGVNCDPAQNPIDSSTIVTTPEGRLPLGGNMLPTECSNNYDSHGDEMPNTAPSCLSDPFDPEKPLYKFYKLMDGPPLVRPIDPVSPTGDLHAVIERALKAALGGQVDHDALKFGIDVLEGNPIPRFYSGFALLHYTGPEKIKKVVPVTDSRGRVIGGNVDIHQIWFDNHIESDTSLLDPTDVYDVSWTITYTIDVLDRGADDFAPYIMYFDAPPMPLPGIFGKPKVGMDAAFYPVAEGTRVKMKIKMAPAKYLSLIYTWGWRWHPPRAQATENALKPFGGMNLAEWEIRTFGSSPRADRKNQLAAIAKLGELSPAKRMWQSLTRANAPGRSPKEVAALMSEAEQAFEEWLDRTHLPSGVKADPKADVTLLFVNNTIYASGVTSLAGKWPRRPATIKITLLNGDHFVHGYMNADFGGARGWENQFQQSGGEGCNFSFGRDYWWINAGGKWGWIELRPVSGNGLKPGTHKVILNLNFDPPPRLRLYNFDPLHHDVAIYSIH